MTFRTSKSRFGILVVLASQVLTACTGREPPGPAPETHPDIVLIVTDDQRWDTIRRMPTVRRELVAEGVTFSNAFAVNPECCPSRASILTGQYSHTTGVYTNDGPTAIAAFDESSTLATSLNGAGYRTALVGKYLNHYRGPEIPPGWDRWIGYSGPFAYFGYTLNEDGRLRRYGDREADYATDVLGDAAVELIEQTPKRDPLFLYFAPFAPHAPAVPAPRHQDAFEDLPAYRPPSYNEADLSDKPAWLQRVPPVAGKTLNWLQGERPNEHRSLLAVDEAVAGIIDALRSSGRLNNALVVFLSDNGRAWGEHRWVFKGAPYEEVIRIPMVVRYDPLSDSGRSEPGIVANIDLAPTIAELARIEIPNVDGRSLWPVLEGDANRVRRSLLIEHLFSPRSGGRLRSAPTFCAVRSPGVTYVKYATGEEELYRLHEDPHQLDNLARDPAWGELRDKFERRAADLCHPRPPGMPAS
jgi:N-acetylglucosamine-6-sulfatase